MLYKTIVLELIEQQPRLSEALQSSDSLLSTMNELAIGFRELHLYHAQTMSQLEPNVSLMEIRSRAMTRASSELQEVLEHSDAMLPLEPFSLEACLMHLASHGD